eukprot:TRINITY_DN47853_c0_g1_i1.p1 TRINITY_DN47853_c0_g1~~TRINITY_DN47853_c0_g1_i1.p1  ORF type:complete len:833 (-),score=192.82 TRINITY_DN47853_c0_g1_i1:41-2539(-)
MLSPEDVMQIKEAFSHASRGGGDTISAADLSQVFQELDDWPAEDLKDLFAAAGFAGKDINYRDLVDWIMQDDGGAPSQPPVPGKGEGESDAESEDYEATEMMAAKSAPPQHNYDLHEEISYEEWMVTLHIDGESLKEAHHEFEVAAREQHQLGKEAAVDKSLKVPLHALAEVLGTAEDDENEMEDLEKDLAKAREMIAKGESKAMLTSFDNDRNSCCILDAAINAIVRQLDWEKRPAEDAWSLICEDHMCISERGMEALSEFEGRQAELVQKVKDCMSSPPLLSLRAGKQGAKEHCQKKVKKIIENCKATGTKFTDTEFNLVDDAKILEALYVDKCAPGYDCTVAKPAGAKRLSELIQNPKLFKDGIRPGDIVQGQIGTCFLLGALGAVSGNNERAIGKLFLDYDIESGVYGVRFCLDGEWTYVIIDDYMPVDAHGRLLYARGNDPEEMWVPLLEKAYCKLNTCYEECDGGFPSEAAVSFYGGIRGKLSIGKAQKANPPVYFQTLQNARSRGWLLTTTFKETQLGGGKAGHGKCGEAVLSSGLVGGHVYSVLRVVEAGGNRLVCCRNPWATGEWKGKWSDKNSYGEWTQEMKDAVGFTGANDGKFWMSIEDFVACSGGVSYARTFGPQWKKITQYGKFQTGDVLATSMWAYQAASDDEITFPAGAKISVKTIAKGWWYGELPGTGKPGYFPANYVKMDNRPVACFELQATPSPGSTEPMKAVFMLQQPDAHILRRYVKHQKSGLNYKDNSYGKIMLCVVDQTGKIVSKKAGKKRSVNAEINLPAGGVYKVYAFSIDGCGSNYSVRCFVRGGTAQLTEAKGAALSDLSAALSA